MAKPNKLERIIEGASFLLGILIIFLTLGFFFEQKLVGNFITSPLVFILIWGLPPVLLLRIGILVTNKEKRTVGYISTTLGFGAVMILTTLSAYQMR